MVGREEGYASLVGREEGYASLGVEQWYMPPWV